jgi:phosphotransferase system  glucose/maltose/N-acetylglucosamine-specific IIC component
MDIIIFLVIFSALIGYWANNYGRNGWLWFFIALLISPLITSIVLLFMGRDGDAKAKKESDEIEAEAQKAAAIEKRKSELLDEKGK